MRQGVIFSGNWEVEDPDAMQDAQKASVEKIISPLAKSVNYREEHI